MFKHKMAKVRCVLKRGEGITEDDFKTIRLTCHGFTSVSFSEDAFTPSGDGWITPYSYSDDDSKSVFEALLPPMDKSDEAEGFEFIKVVLDVKVNNITNTKTLIYKPAGLKLDAGTAYTYNITVQKDRLEVEPIEAAWNDSVGEGAKADLSRINLPANHPKPLKLSSNVTPMPDKDNPEYLLVQGFVFSISYKANDENRMNGFLLPDQTHKMTRTEEHGDYVFEFKLAYQEPEGITLDYGGYAQVGDFYYSDGTWGRYHPNAWSEENKNGVKIIGIVFKAGSSGTDDKLDNYSDEDWKDKPTQIRGYVVALNDASQDKGIWADQKTCQDSAGKFRLFGPKSYSKIADSPYSGYIITNIIRTQEAGIYGTTEVNVSPENGFTNGFWAFKVACEYEPAAPSNSSGWYLPSIRQWEVLLNLYGLRSCFDEAGGTNFRESDGEYWTSTEYSVTSAWIVRYHLGTTSNSSKHSQDRTNRRYVRSVLTF